MLTEKQITAELYNALTGDATLTNLIGDRLYWIARPTKDNTFPLIVYSKVDNIAGYAFGGSLQSDEGVVQLDVYTDPSEVNQMDDIVQAIKPIMQGLCYRNTSTPPQFLEADINKIVRPIRWERINV